MPVKPRNTDTITFSLPLEMAQQLRQVVKEEDRTVSELLREAIRLYMEEREWRRLERLARLHTRGPLRQGLQRPPGRDWCWRLPDSAFETSHTDGLRASY